MATGSRLGQRMRDTGYSYAATVTRWLIEPLTVLEEKQRRRIRLLSAFLLLIAINTLIGALVIKNAGNNSWVILLAAASILAAGYGFSRTRYYGLAKGIAVSMPAVPVFAMVFFSDNPEHIPHELPWLALPLLVCSLVFSLRSTIIVTITYITLVLSLVYFAGLPAAEFGKSLAYILMIFFFTVAITTTRRQDQSEIEHDLAERQRAEEALRESEERFSKIFSASPVSITMNTFKDGTFIYVNDSFTRMSGYTREDVVGRRSADVGIWANIEDRKRMIKILEEQGRVYTQEFEFVTKSGEIRTWLYSAEKINVGGEPCLIVLSIDVTERKKREQLQNDENYVLTLLGQGAELSEVLDAILRLGESNDPSIKGSVLLFDSSRDWLMPAAGPSLPDEYNEMMKDGIPIGPVMGSCGTAAYRKERVIIPDIENDPLFKPSAEAAKGMTGNGLRACWSQPIVSSGGELLGTIANYSNRVGEPTEDNLNILDWSARIAAIAIERKKAEEALRESEEKFSKAFSSSPEAFFITRLKDGIITEVNESCTHFTGYTREEMVGHVGDELNLWVYDEERTRMLQSIEEQGRVYKQEIHSRMKSGEIRVGLFSAEMLNIGGEPGFIFSITDITERKKAEENLKQTLATLEKSSAQLAATNKELEAFSYSVSHDLRSPLRSIDGFSQALLEDYYDKLDETGQDYLHRLRGASQKMGELIDGLLKLSRLTRSEMRPEMVDLSALASEIAARLHETQPERRVEFIISRGLTANGDRQLLRVLLENLLGNAWKFTLKSPQARIEFGKSRNGDKKTYYVRDNGIGFDMTYADKLFGAFQRLHEETEFPGTGIGLATVQRVINRHGGTVWAEGDPGKGATFYFTLN